MVNVIMLTTLVPFLTKKLALESQDQWWIEKGWAKALI